MPENFAEFRLCISCTVGEKVADKQGSDSHQDPEAHPSQRAAVTGAPFASESQPTAEENKPAGNPKEAKAHQSGTAKTGPRRPNPADQPHGAQTPQIDENTTNRPTYCSQRVTPNKCLPVALPLKSITVSGLIVVPHISTHRFKL